MDLTDEILDTLADRVAQRIRGPRVTDEILTRAEAMHYTKNRSQAAFTAWCKRWGVRATDRGRWSLHRLDLGLQREAGTKTTPAAIRASRQAA